MANKNITQLTQQTGTANTTSLLYAVVGLSGNQSDTSLPLSVLFNSPTFTGTPTVPGYAPLNSPVFVGPITGPTASISLGGMATFASLQSTPVGTTAPAAGQFTTLAATGAVNFSSGTISNVTIGGSGAAAGTFTTLAATGAVTFTSGTINGTSIGATTASTGAFTTLSASSTVSGTGFSTYLASPPAIGGTTPAGGAFTTLSASSTVSGVGFSTYLASPPAIGGTTPSTGKFTTLQATSTITPSSTAGIVGTTTNDNANAGSVGEYVTATASGISLASITPVNITSISLTAGDWDVSGVVRFNGTSLNATTLLSSVSTTSATIGALGFYGQQSAFGATAAVTGNWVIPTPVARITLTTTTTVYLVANQAFSAGTATGDGLIRARRVR